MTEDRKTVLLRAAFDMLRTCRDAHYVSVFYDDAECDGSCLLVDIACELEIDEDTDPLRVPVDHWSRAETV